MSKSAKSVSIISGSDGPTSILFSGKGRDKNPFHNLRHVIQNKKYSYKRKIVEKSIVAEPHTLDEMINYMKKKYAMTEVNSSYPLYNNCKREMKFALAQSEHWELLGMSEQENLQNQEEISKWYDELIIWEKGARKIVDELSSKTLKMDYYMYILDLGKDGLLQIEIEMNRQLIQTQYSGNKKVIEPIIRDIFLYYGASQEDINNNTERYQELVLHLLR